MVSGIYPFSKTVNTVETAYVVKPVTATVLVGDVEEFPSRKDELVKNCRVSLINALLDELGEAVEIAVERDIIADRIAIRMTLRALVKGK